MKSNSEIINRRRAAALDRQGWMSLLGRVIVIGLAGWALLTQVFLISQTSGNGMFPAVKDGDLIIGFRLQQEYAKEDVVVYLAQGRPQVGRIMARETDVISISESGSVQVNGTPQTGQILYPTYAKEGLTYPYRVPQGCVFVLGDYRTQTKDSRDYGPIPLDQVQAKVITILRRRGL